MSIFTKIIAGEIPCHKLAEDDQFFAFLDIRPIAEGHALVIPKEEIDYVFDVPADLMAGLMEFSRKVARALEKTVPCKKVGIMVAGLEVPHCHIHLVPIQEVTDLNFANAKEASPSHLAELAADVRSHLV